MNGSKNEWTLSADEKIWLRNDAGTLNETTLSLVVLLRVRNEELILEDTLNHISKFADMIVAYDDASTDGTLAILKQHHKVVLVVENGKWLSSVADRLQSETRHRGLLLQLARHHWSFRWCMCCDADERFVGDIRCFVTEQESKESFDAVKIQLFDAYMTPEDYLPYRRGEALLDFRCSFGPERRDILMLWKNTENVCFVGLDSREPCLAGRIGTMFYCQHYGKSLSLEHWEGTCQYYINYFPFEPYGRKWSARLGKGVHTLSDFGRQLYPWGEQLFHSAVTEF